MCLYVLRMHMHVLTDAYSQVHDVLVEYKRMDILTPTQWVVTVLDSKWETYAEREFSKRLRRASIFTALMLVISCAYLPPKEDAGEGVWGVQGVQSLERGNWRELAVDARLRVCFDVVGRLALHVSEVAALLVMLPSFLSDFRVFWANGLSLTSTLEQLFSLCTLPITSVIVWLRWSRCGWGLDASQLPPPHSSEGWHLWRAGLCLVSCVGVARACLALHSSGQAIFRRCTDTRPSEPDTHGEDRCVGGWRWWFKAEGVAGPGSPGTHEGDGDVGGWLSGSWSWFKAAGVGFACFVCFDVLASGILPLEAVRWVHETSICSRQRWMIMTDFGDEMYSRGCACVSGGCQCATEVTVRLGATR